MTELLEIYQNELVLATTVAIVSVIKGVWIFAKMDTRTVSLLVATVLVVIVKFVAIPENVLLTVENLGLVLLPSFGYDYFLKPVISDIWAFIKSLGK